MLSIKFILLLLFCYLIQDCASSSYLFSFIFVLFSNSLREKNYFSLSSCIVFSAVAFYFIKMSTMNMIKSLSSKPEKFTGENFFCWQQQMKFWLIELDLYSVISKREIKTSTFSTDIVQTDATIKYDVISQST